MSKKRKLTDDLMNSFHKNAGGTLVSSDGANINPDILKKGLQDSFERIFPELMKKEKHRKHVIFDDDVFRFFEEMSQSSNSNFSSLINSALRAYLQSRISRMSHPHDLLDEFIATRERERELLKEIKKQNLLKELEKKLG